MGGKKAGQRKAKGNKGKAEPGPVAAQGAKGTDDDAFLAAAMTQAAAERAQLQAAKEAAEAARLAAEAAAAEKAASLRAPLPSDRPATRAMPPPTLPKALTVAPGLARMLAATPSAAAATAAPAAPRAVDYSRETPRERELRLRQAKAKYRMATRAYADRRGGKRALTTAPPPSTFYGDESAEEIASSRQLIVEYLTQYPRWLCQQMRGTGLLEAAPPAHSKDGDHFALLFKFDTSDDPVCKQPKAHLGGRLDVLIVCYKRALYWLHSDHPDGLVAAAKKGALDPLLAPFNVVDVLPGGVKPTGLGVRMTALEALEALPYLNAEAYPGGVPCELVLKGKAWADGVSAADSVAAAMAAAGDDDEEEALDAVLMPNPNGGAGGDGGEASDDPVSAAIRKELRRLGPARFPLSQVILDVFRGGSGSAMSAPAPAPVPADALEDGEEEGNGGNGGNGDEEAERA